MWSGVDQARPPLAAIFSVGSERLSETGKRLFRKADPLGFILFARNCKNPRQLKNLTDELKEAVGRDCPILTDQEGGRVQRMKPPNWKAHPAAYNLSDVEEVTAVCADISRELPEAGINVNCAPVLDVLSDKTHEIIGDRAFSDDPQEVAEKGLAACRAYIDAGITPVIKHLPGHGCASADSHKELPRVDLSLNELERDSSPFRNIAGSDISPAIWGMSAHVIYEAIDPGYPASISLTVIREVIRGEIGFDGLLLCDDLEMKALDGYGDISQKAMLALEAGNDAVLHCNGKIEEMEALAENLPRLSEDSVERLNESCLSGNTGS